MTTVHEPPQASARAVARNVGELANDVIELGELQTQLFKTDAQDWLGRVTTPAAVIAVGGAVVLGSIPLLLSAMSNALVEYASFRPWAANLLAGVVGAAVGAALAFWGWSRIKSGKDAFSRSREELSSNVRWLKYVLQHRPQRPNRVSA